MHAFVGADCPITNQELTQQEHRIIASQKQQQYSMAKCFRRSRRRMTK